MGASFRLTIGPLGTCVSAHKAEGRGREISCTRSVHACSLRCLGRCCCWHRRCSPDRHRRRRSPATGPSTRAPGRSRHDSSAGGHPLTLQNGASWGQGVVGPSALSLSGAGQYAEAGSPLIDTTRQLHRVGVGQPVEHGRLSDVRQPGRQPGERLLPAAARGHAPVRVHPDRLRLPAGRSERSPRRRRSSRSRASGTTSPASTTRSSRRSRCMSTGRSSRRSRSSPTGRRAARSRSAAASSTETRWTSSPAGSTTPGSTAASSAPARSRSSRARTAHRRRLAGGPGDQPDAVRRVPRGDQPLRRRRPVRGADP